MAINRIKTGSITDGTIQSGDLAPGTIASDRIAPGTIANDRLANNTITINGTAIALGASGEIVAGTDWKAVTVADGSTTVNTVAGGGYLLDTNAGVIEAFLPTSPSRGDTVVIADYSGTFATNRVIVNTGGANIDSTATGDVQLTTNNIIAEFVYIDSAKGWLVKSNQVAGTTPSSVLTDGLYDATPDFISATGGTVTTSGNYKVHSFTGDGCFVVSNVGNPFGSNTVDYLVVAGGGSGGGSFYGGGGGAGGFRLSNSVGGIPAPTMSPLANPTGLPVSVTTYPVTVGGGGAPIGSPAPNSAGNSGSNSIFSTITSAGGGGGGTDNPPAYIGGPGGSGGGNGTNDSESGSVLGNGNTPPVSPPQGNPGARGHNYAFPPSYGGGGGGGAGSAGLAGCGTNQGKGGTGSYVSPSFAVGCAGTTGPVCGVRYFAGGGGGANDANVTFTLTSTSGAGGAGGGGCSAQPNYPEQSGPAKNRTSVAGTANTGGGGGGGGYCGSNIPSGAGGKGIVMIRYKFQ